MKPLGTVTLLTPRLELRRFHPDDALMMFANYCNDPEVTKHLTWKPHSDVGVTHGYVEMIIKNYRNPYFFHWAIVDRVSLQVIGAIDFVKISQEKQSGEIGYVLSRKYWNRGLMSETLQKVTEFAFEKVGFLKVFIRANVDNQASIRAQEKCGYQLNFIEKDVPEIDTQELMDIAYRSLTKEQYLKRTQT
ncbi:MAG: GNAT family N-acetyltransferase [Bacilli bacterium]|jgi:ribosomal-protein-alanine N-acetyltransferase